MYTDAGLNWSKISLKKPSMTLSYANRFADRANRHCSPAAVALSICNMGLDAPTVVASLLHDAIEDTSITWDYLSQIMGNGTQILLMG